jgi:hypothetical protein
LPQFAARAAIDGRTGNQRHGKRFPSWGPDKRTDIWWQVDFGREVTIDKVTLLIRADFPHDSHGHAATLAFSDGSRESIRITKTEKQQHFPISPRTVSWMRITDLAHDEPRGRCAPSEVQVWGRDAADARFAWKPASTR